MGAWVDGGRKEFATHVPETVECILSQQFRIPRFEYGRTTRVTVYCDSSPSTTFNESSLKTKLASGSSGSSITTGSRFSTILGKPSLINLSPLFDHCCLLGAILSLNTGLRGGGAKADPIEKTMEDTTRILISSSSELE